jgi:hypothetical protein
MIRFVTLALFVAAQLPIHAAAACAGADPAVTSVKVQNVSTSGSLNQYHILGTVTNLGTQGQPGNVLQSVDIFLNGQHLDTKGIPPLRPSQAYSFTYVWQRATDAGAGTTEMLFKLRLTQPSPPGNEDCDASNDSFTLKF